LRVIPGSDRGVKQQRVDRHGLSTSTLVANTWRHHLQPALGPSYARGLAQICKPSGRRSTLNSLAAGKDRQHLQG
jgi:hypothetical protein